MIDLLDPQIEEKLKELQASLLAQAPEHVRKLGKILRRRSLFSLRKFLVEHGYAGRVPAKDMMFFMDYLILQRIDLKDMHEDARKRLRAKTLEGQSPDVKTADYVKYVDGMEGVVHCRNCQWFMQAPPDESESCVQMGKAKGADDPCYGFTKKKVP